MKKTDMYELHDADLETVAGGMSCQTGKIVSGIYSITSDVLMTLQDYEGASKFRNLSQGVYDGACG